MQRRGKNESRRRDPDQRDFRVDPSDFDPDEPYGPSRGRGAEESYTRSRYLRSAQKQQRRQERIQNRKKKPRKGLIVFLIVIWVLAAVAAALFFVGRGQISSLKTKASDVKSELRGCVTAAKEMNPDELNACVDRIKGKNGEILEQLDNPFWKAVSLIPYFGEDITTVKNLITALDGMADGILAPFAELIREYPISDLRVNEADVNVALILRYLDFLDQVQPQMEEAAEKLGGAQLHMKVGSFEEYAEKMQSASHMLETVSKYKDLLRSFLGNGEDRTYVLLAQNTAETRAAGGFPGSVGSITIQNGLLSIGSFMSVYDVMYNGMLAECGITDREVELFQYMYAGQAHDATFNPHFPKAAHIVKTAYDEVNGTYTNGVVSLTPQIIQDILAVTGNSFFLADGTYIDGTNATRTIERLLYLNYMADDFSAIKNNLYVDLLFAQTAAMAMKAMFENLNAETLLKYVDVIEKGFQQRTVMLWLQDPQEQQYCLAAGASGSLNFDPMNPQVGVYYSILDPSKLGMYLSIDTTIGEPAELPDGSLEYPVQVVLNNYLDEDGSWVSSTYILGNYGGGIMGYMYFFAPAGGSIYDFSVSDGRDVLYNEYEGLEVGYILDKILEPSDPLTVNFKVTTAPGAAPLTLSQTQTLQNYR